MTFTTTPRGCSRVAVHATSSLLALTILAGCGGGPLSTDTSTGLAAESRARALSSTAPSASDADTSRPKPPLLTIRAAGSLLAGIGAHAIVRYRGQVIAEGEVGSAEFTDYRMELTGPLDGGVLEVALTNALGSAGQTLRTLQIDALFVSGVELRPTDADVLFDEGDGAAAFDGKNTSPGGRTMARNGALRFNLPTAQEAAAAVLPATSAPGFYIDAERGDDSQAGSYQNPWRTLSRVPAVAVQSGEGVYLRCGGLWRATLALTAAQLKDGVTVAGYGPECNRRKAVVSGADDFSGGWQVAGNVWSRSLPNNTLKISQLFVDGVPLRTAQWPNATGAAGGTGLAASGASSNKRVALQTADISALAGKDLVGATAQLRTQKWLVETRKVSAATAGQIDVDRAPDWTMDAGKTYVLQDKLWMLDSPGEFFHDVEAQKLYLVLPTTGTVIDPNRALIEGSVRDVALSLTQRSGLVVRDLALNATRADGLRMADTPAARVSRLEARQNAETGMRLTQWPKLAASASGPSITDSLVDSNGRYGIDAVEVDRAVITHNQVRATGTSVQHQAGVIAAIASGPGGRTEDNTVDGSGYLGIHFSSQGGSVVARNTVSGQCARLVDCAGIYTWTGRALSATAQGAVVEHNRVLGGHAARDTTAPNPNDVVIGIYIDDFSHGVTVRNNLIANTPVGIFIHNASRTMVTNNRIWLPTLTGLWASMDQTDADWMTQNSFRDNFIAPVVQATATGAALPSFGAAQAVWFWHAVAGESALQAGGNQFVSNTVYQLQGPLETLAVVRGPQGERQLDALAWRALNTNEAAPLRPVRFDALIPLLGPEQVVDGQFEAGLSHWLTYRNPVAWGFETEALAGRAGCTGNCMGFTAGDRGDLLGSRAFSMRSGATHVYRWTATMPATLGATVGLPYISRDGTPWDIMADGRGFVGYGTRSGGPGETVSYETYFTAKESAPARVNLQLETPRVKVGFDAVSVREVLGYTVARTTDWSALVMAPVNASRTVGCADLGWPEGCSAMGLNGQPLTLPRTLAANEELYVLRADSPFRR